MSGKKVSTFRERFTELVVSSGKSQSSIADEFHVAKQTISAWITGQSSPRSPVLSALADYFGVSVAWLMGFDVPKISPALIKELTTGDLPVKLPDYFDNYVSSSNELPSDEQELLILYRGADDRAREDALDTLRKHQKQDTAAKVI